MISATSFYHCILSLATGVPFNVSARSDRIRCVIHTFCVHRYECGGASFYVHSSVVAPTRSSVYLHICCLWIIFEHTTYSFSSVFLLGGPLRWWATSMCSEAAGSCARQESSSSSFATHCFCFWQGNMECGSRKNWSPCVSREGRVCGSRALTVFVHLLWDGALSYRRHGWYFSGIVLISRNSNRFLGITTA